MRCFYLCLAVFGVSCGVSEPEAPVGPDDDLWPTPRALPSCSGDYQGAFADPAITTYGFIEVSFSADLQPVGVEEVVDIAVRVDPSYELDTSFNGVVEISGTNIEVVSQPTMVDGRGSAVVRFLAAGPGELDASIDGDGRVGHSEAVGFVSQLPVWNLTIAASDLDAMLAAPADSIYMPMTVDIAGEEHTGRVRLHGGSSRYWLKKSFRFNLDQATEWGEKQVLRAEWRDPTLMRHWINMRLFRDGTWIPTPDNRFVHFRINGRFYGLMLHAERVDPSFLLRRGLSPGGSLYEADPPIEYSVPGGNLSPLTSRAEYEIVYQHHAGAIAYDDLIALIEGPIANRAIDGVIDVNNAIVYLAMMAAIQNHDHVRKNFYLYRDDLSPSDSAWHYIPWDLDLSLGHLWTEENDILDEAITTDADIFTGEYAPERFGFYNELIDAILKHPVHRETFLVYLERIVDKTFTDDRIADYIDNILCRATPEILADWRKRDDTSLYLDRVDEIIDFVAGRRVFIDEQLAQ